MNDDVKPKEFASPCDDCPEPEENCEPEDMVGCFQLAWQKLRDALAASEADREMQSEALGEQINQQIEGRKAERTRAESAESALAEKEARRAEWEKQSLRLGRELESQAKEYEGLLRSVRTERDELRAVITDANDHGKTGDFAEMVRVLVRADREIRALLDGSEGGE